MPPSPRELTLAFAQVPDLTRLLAILSAVAVTGVWASRRWPRTGRALATLGTLPVLLLAIGYCFLSESSERVHLKRTMGSIRTVGTALETYAVDHDHYPDPPRDPRQDETGSRLATWSTGGPRPVTDLAPYLVPTYVRDLPTTDDWGRPLLFDSSGHDYVVVSTAADAIPDRLPGHGGSVTDGDSDWVLMDGGFVQY